MATKLIALTLAVGAQMTAGDFPQAEIKSRFLDVKLYTPDEKHGYYRGSRFDWSGVISSLTYQGHEYFGVWFPHYDALLHDAITGPVEEFRGDDGALGYSETKPGGMFLKIGVGVLRKPDDQAYNFARGYQLVNPGKRVVRLHADHIDFEQEISDGEGWGYAYKKTVRVEGKRPQLILEHSLKNTGKRVIDTAVYNHDFYMIDGEPTGPGMRVRFAFKPMAPEGLKDKATIQGDEIVFAQELGPRGDSAAGLITGFGETAESNDIRVENLKTGAGVREMGDRPVSKLYFWSIKTTVCPEAYIKVHVEPGQTFRWRIVYEFYTTGKKTKETGDGA